MIRTKSKLLTGQVRGTENVVVEVLLHQYTRHPLTLNTFFISQAAHHLRKGAYFILTKDFEQKKFKRKKDGTTPTLASFSPLKLSATASVLRGLWTSMWTWSLSSYSLIRAAFRRAISFCSPWTRIWGGNTQRWEAVTVLCEQLNTTETF